MILMKNVSIYHNKKTSQMRRPRQVLECALRIVMTRAQQARRMRASRQASGE